MKSRALVANIKDNVATAIDDIRAGEVVLVKAEDKQMEVTVNCSIPFGHKFALEDIEAGSDVIKYGEIIGRASLDIKKGEHVHVHNVESRRGRGDIFKKGRTAHEDKGL